MVSADPGAIKNEANRWFALADTMSEIRQVTASLYLGPIAFFPGGLGTEIGYHTKYFECHREMVDRLQGGAIEFELIGITLRRIAESYEEGDRVTADSFRVLERDVERATEEHTPRQRSYGGGQPFE